MSRCRSEMASSRDSASSATTGREPREVYATVGARRLGLTSGETTKGNCAELEAAGGDQGSSARVEGDGAASNPEREPGGSTLEEDAGGAPTGVAGAKRGAQRFAAETGRSPPGRPPVEPKAERRGFLEPGTPEQRRQRRTEERGTRRLEKAVQKRERRRLEP